MNDTSPEAGQARPKQLWSPVLVLVVVLGATLLSQTVLRRQPPEKPVAPAADPPAGAPAVTLVIDSADGEPLERKAAWCEGMTVLELFAAMGNDPRTQIQTHNSGEQAFITSIGGVEHEAAEGRYWQYYINGKWGELGAGAQPVAPGDRVLWKLAPGE